MPAFYNEIDPYAAQWLRNLIAAGHIAPGIVDERSIVDLDPDELRGFTQCHFFAGIGVWSHALRLAGWPDDRPVWTGSCPCQPFSAAGKGLGHEDDRHLWPTWHRLIRERSPAAVFGEQVAGGDGLAWLDLVLPDLEDDHYAVAAANLPAAGVGGPHIRQRLFFMGYAPSARDWKDTPGMSATRPDGRIALGSAATTGLPRFLADDDPRRQPAVAGVRLRRESLHDPDGRGAVRGFWAGADWLGHRDGWWRPVEPGAFPVADGTPELMDQLRACGNAIVAPLAAEFIRAAVEAMT